MNTRLFSWIGIAVLGLVIAAVWMASQVSLPLSHAAHPSSNTLEVQGPEILRSELVLRDGKLYRVGETHPFTGIRMERYEDGSLRTKCGVVEGFFQGELKAWHINGQLQVVEHFKKGISHGLRTKFHPNGAKLSEVELVEGKFQGTFRRWSEKGQLMEEADFVGGKLHGQALAFREDGTVKARAEMREGMAVGPGR